MMLGRSPPGSPTRDAFEDLSELESEEVEGDPSSSSKKMATRLIDPRILGRPKEFKGKEE